MPAAAQLDGNSDEVRVGAYTLPPVLTMADGRPVTDARGWRKRRAELVRLFEQSIYGVAPTPLRQRYVLDEQGIAFGGLAVRRQVTILLDGRRDGPQMRVLLYLPARAKGRVPVFVGPNFHGNQAINADPAIAITPGWVTPATGIRKGSATVQSRGIDTAEWPIETILAAGYGVATYFTGDLYPDDESKRGDSIQPYFRTNASDPAHWGAVATWAWGLSRVYDYLATDRAADPAWRLAMDAAWSCDPRARRHLARLNAFFRGVGAKEIRDGYRLDGTPYGKWHNAAFVAPVMTHHTKGPERKRMLERFRSGAWPLLITSKVLNDALDRDEVVLFEPMYDSYQACIALAGLMPSYLTFALMTPLLGFSALTMITAANALVRLSQDGVASTLALPASAVTPAADSWRVSPPMATPSWRRPTRPFRSSSTTASTS